VSEAATGVHWQTAELGDLCEPVSKVQPTDSPDTPFTYIEISAIDNEMHRVARPQVLLGREAPSRARQSVRSGDVLLSTVRPYLKNIAAVSPELDGAVASTGFCVLRPNSTLNPSFLLHFVLTEEFTRTLTALQRGVSYPAVRDVDVRIQKIPIPPREEQDQIVASIEEQFSRLEVGTAAMGRVRTYSTLLRAAVLEGAMTDSIALGAPTAPIVPISEIVASLDQGWSPRCEDRPSEDDREWAVIKTTAVQSLSFDGAANKRLPDALKPRTDYELVEGDLLITRAGPRSRVGVCCLVRRVRPRLMICDKVYRLRTNKNVALPEFVELALNTPSISRSVDGIKTGISDSGVNITQKAFLALQIPLPSLDVQEGLVQVAHAQLSRIDALNAYLAATATRVNRLRSSLLSSAFSGSLVAHPRHRLEIV
jgi:type I restriction enzyme S subunit